MEELVAEGHCPALKNEQCLPSNGGLARSGKETELKLGEVVDK